MRASLIVTLPVLVRVNVYRMRWPTAVKLVVSPVLARLSCGFWAAFTVTAAVRTRSSDGSAVLPPGRSAVTRAAFVTDP